MHVIRIFWLHLLLAVIALALWDTPVVKPFRVFVIWIHEMGHAGMALATGGEVEELRVRWNESGHVISRGGIFPLISSAGYVGSAVLGALLIYSGRWLGAQRIFLGLIGAVQIGMAILYTPVWGLDFWFGVGCGLVLIIVTVRFDRPAHVLATWIGVMLCLYSLYDFRTDLWMQTERTDAGILARHFGISMLAYPIAFVWAGISLCVMFWAMKGLSRRNDTLANSTMGSEAANNDADS
ncbi:MAG: M50 family metallopeptidase, partial [Candidatus Latescibacteria bacterium]|nr:M50 family metallopeptidase [Candidatus Latescibacterota bacterium]